MADEGRPNRRQEVVIFTVVVMFATILVVFIVLLTVWKLSYAITESLRIGNSERSGGLRRCRSLLSFFLAGKLYLGYQQTSYKRGHHDATSFTTYQFAWQAF